MRVTVKDAARRLGVSEQFIRIGLQQNRLPIGTAVKMSSVWTYYISAEQIDNFIKKEPSAATDGMTAKHMECKAERTI